MAILTSVQNLEHFIYCCFEYSIYLCPFSLAKIGSVYLHLSTYLSLSLALFCYVPVSFCEPLEKLCSKFDTIATFALLVSACLLLHSKAMINLL